jgi:polar amino acid transport system substrate-binding protein
VLATCLRDGYEVAAGVKQQLIADAKHFPDLRMLPGRFMQIAQAMGIARKHGPQAANALAAFVEQMKAQGFVAKSLQQHGIEGALVAPPAPVFK